MRSIKPLYYLYQAYKFLIYAPLIGGSTAMVALLLGISSFFFKDKLGYPIGRIWGRINSWGIPMYVSIRGKERITKGQSYIVIANHQSLLDIPAIYGWLPVDFRWVMKQELRKVPFLGYYCHIAGHVYIDRKNRESAIASINEARNKIKDGVCILFFAEGTRSNDGILLPFKKGAFKFAMDMGLPVLPVTIDGSKNVLPNNTIDLFPGKCRLVINEPIDTAGFTDDTIEELMEKTRIAIQSGFAEETESTS